MRSSSRGAFAPWVILALVSFSVFLGALDLTVVSTILRQVIYDLEIPFPAGLNDAAWIVTGYLLAYTVTMPIMGRLSDLKGRRRVYLFCLGFFVVGSSVVALAPSLPVLIFGRVLQALGAGALVPISMAVAGDVFPESRRALALGVIGAVDTAGWVVGPLYGALMVTQFQWRWIFIINLPLGLLAAVLVFFVLRGMDEPSQTTRMDWSGSLLLIVALAALTLALTGSSGGADGGFAAASSSTGGGLNPNAPVYAALFLLAGLLFWWRERRAPSPLVEPALFRRPTLAAACAVNLLVGGALIAAVVDVPLFVNTVLLIARNLNPAQADLQSGLILAILTSSMVVAAVVGGFLTERLGYRGPALLGLAIAAGGFALLRTWGPTLDDLTQLRDLVVCGLGLGLVISPIATAVIDTAPEEHRGSAAALVLIMRLIGMTATLSALTTWGVLRFDELSRAVPLAGLTADFVTRVSAQVMDEIFTLALGVCVLAFAAALALRSPRTRPTHAVHSWL